MLECELLLGMLDTLSDPSTRVNRLECESFLIFAVTGASSPCRAVSPLFALADVVTQHSVELPELR